MYFFRDENGGCVLFDSLGPPWPIHDCWMEHVRRASISAAIEEELEAIGFDGSHYRPQGIKLAKPDKTGSKLDVVGFVADNQALGYEPPRVFQLQSHRRTASLPLVILEVAANGFLYPFVLSEANATEIPDYSFVKITGTWRRKSRRWYLMTNSVWLIEPDQKSRKRRTQFTLTGFCVNCGQELGANAQWGIDDGGSEECATCGAMRGQMPRESFIEHLRAVLARHA